MKVRKHLGDNCKHWLIMIAITMVIFIAFVGSLLYLVTFYIPNR